MVNITLDTNCLVDLELNEGAVNELRGIVSAHDSGRCSISVPGIGASERLKDGSFAQNFSTFQQRISKLARREFEILKPLLFINMAYIDWAVIGTDETIKMERKIHAILFPKTPYLWADEAAVHGLDPDDPTKQVSKEWLKWRNRRCDTLAIWCHIYYEKDLFVTRDNNFHKATKKAALEKMGAKHMVYPSEVKL